MNIKKFVEIIFLITTVLLFLNCNSQSFSNSNIRTGVELPEILRNEPNKSKIIDTAASLIIESCEKQKEECKDFKVFDAKIPATEPEMRDGIRTLWLINLKYNHRPKTDTTKEWSETSSWVKVKEMTNDKISAESY